MIIAISTESDEISPHFGRASQFTFLNIKNNKLIEKKILNNPGHTIGNIPNFIREQGANIVIAGSMGNRAIQYFNDYNIEVILAKKGKVNDIIRQILDGSLNGEKI